MKTNIEVHFFRGDPGKKQDTWMYSVRDSDGYRRCEAGASSLLLAALKAACEIEGFSDLYKYAREAVSRVLTILRCPVCKGFCKQAADHSDHPGVMKCVQCDWLGTDLDCIKDNLRNVFQ